MFEKFKTRVQWNRAYICLRIADYYAKKGGVDNLLNSLEWLGYGMQALPSDKEGNEARNYVANEMNKLLERQKRRWGIEPSKEE